MKKLNNKGSTIITAIIVSMVVFIILGAALMIAQNYQQRSINEHARKQAYLNGISVADVIAVEINKNNTNILPDNGNIEKDISNIQLPNGYGGKVTAKVIYDKKESEINQNVLFIQVTSTYNKQTEEVQLTLQKYKNQWYKKAYTEIGERFNDENK